MINLSDHGSQCVISPEKGGCIVSWSVDGQEMMRRSDDAAIACADPLQLASFPLVPYSNRIGDGRFVWGGKTMKARPNFPPEPHAIHGIGWKRIWRARNIDVQSCTLVMEHAGNDEWPWSFAASQRLTLANGALHLDLSATNLSSQPAPLAFGHHPYFDQQGASLQFAATAVLMNAVDALPLDAVPPSGKYDFSELGPIPGRDIDHCYIGWDGIAKVFWEGRPLALEISSNFNTAVVYIPPSSNSFCFEPVPHVNNALNRPDLNPAMPIVEPGGVFEATITMQSVTA